MSMDESTNVSKRSYLSQALAAFGGILILTSIGIWFYQDHVIPQAISSNHVQNTRYDSINLPNMHLYFPGEHEVHQLNVVLRLKVEHSFQHDVFKKHESELSNNLMILFSKQKIKLFETQEGKEVLRKMTQKEIEKNLQAMNIQGFKHVLFKKILIQ